MDLSVVLCRTMPTQLPALTKPENFLARHPVTAYFALTFAVSWLGAFAVAAPDLLRGEAIPKFAGLMMFPAMLVGPSAVGILLTRIADGTGGVRDLFSRMRRIRVPLRWYGVLLIPPVSVLTLLFAMKTFVSRDFAPNRFFVGIGFGFVAGFFEEIGWMGFAFPKMRRADNALAPAILLGLLWAAWHIPVIDYLGTATPHCPYWLPFFLSFAAAMTAMRVLIAWVYSNTNSVLLAQLLHACSTGSLVVFSPPHVTAAQESLWYGIYAAVLWLVVALVAAAIGKPLTSPRRD
jgi:membrane protease YdiL (CAAX protease family)